MRDNHLLWIAREFGNPEYTPLEKADLEHLAEVISTERYGSGARLYREGESADACFLVRSGRVRLVREAVKPTILLGVIGPGQIIGDYAMFCESEHASTAVVEEPVTALKMDRDRIMDVLAMRPRLGLRWMVETLKRLEQAHERLAVALSGSVKRRIAAYVLGATDDGYVEITHQGLAEMIGAERASVSRAIGQLRSEGLLSNSRGSIDIHDRAGLADLLTGGLRDGGVPQTADSMKNETAKP